MKGQQVAGRLKCPNYSLCAQKTCQNVKLKDNYTTPICVFNHTATDQTEWLHQKDERINGQYHFQQCQDTLDARVPAVIGAGAGAAVVVCWAGWGRPRSA